MKNKFFSKFQTPGMLIATMVVVCSNIVRPLSANAIKLRVTIESIVPEKGHYFSPLWFGFHDGSFDAFDLGGTASAGVELIAEDGIPFNVQELGITTSLSSEFEDSGAGIVQNTIFSPFSPSDPFPVPDFFPGEVASVTVQIDPSLGTSQYFSYMSMISPSNDGFFGNDDPLAHKMFDNEGNFIPTTIVVLGADVLDAGTEVNDEDRFHTPLLGPTPIEDYRFGAGIEQNGVIAIHPGFLTTGDIYPNGNILGDPALANADFKTPGYQVARITVTQVPEPATNIAMVLLGGLLLLGRNAWRKL